MKIFYNEFYTASAHSSDTTRKSAAIASSLRSRPVDDVVLVSPEHATFEDLCLVHDPFYVESIMKGGNDLSESSGFSWDEGIWDMTIASTGGVLAAAQIAIETKNPSGSLSSGLHHARFERGEGFCTFNGLMLTAAKYVAQGARVLIIDLDAHCGGGTFDIITNQHIWHKNIWQLDVSTSDFDDYVPTTHHQLCIVRSHEIYIDIIKKMLDGLQNEKFDLVLYNAGMDPYAGCSLGGLAGITASVLKRRECLVFDWCRSHGFPVAFVLAGGYVGPKLSESQLVDLHRLTIEAACR